MVIHMWIAYGQSVSWVQSIHLKHEKTQRLPLGDIVEVAFPKYLKFPYLVLGCSCLRVKSKSLFLKVRIACCLSQPEPLLV